MLKVWRRAYKKRESSPVEEIERQQLNFIEKHHQWLTARATSGKVRDGHGDLRLEHVYFEQSEISIIDCIEFNDRFRFADVCADLAFLVMDLRHHDRSDWAELLLARYCQANGDFEMYRLIDFYEAYRAFVRAKVTALLDQQRGFLPGNYALHRDLRALARRYFKHALAAQRPGIEAPRILAVGGLIASGKSSLAERLSLQACCPCLEADRFRKRLAGVELWEPTFSEPFTDIYGEAMSTRVYSALFEQAKIILLAGRSVVFDASFSTKELRGALLAFAESMGVPLSFVWCQVSPEVTKCRLEKRASGPSVSDGRMEIYEAFVRHSDPFQSNELPASVILDTALQESEQIENLALVEGLRAFVPESASKAD